MRRLSGLVIAAGLLVMVGSLAWACLYSSVDAASASAATVVAVAALMVVVVGILARGQGTAAIAKIRQIIGALGLFLTPVAAAMTLLALVDPLMVPWFLLLTVVSVLAWLQGIAAQTGLSLRVLSMWLTALVLFAAGAAVVGGVIGVISVGVLDGLGLDPDQGTRIAFGLTLASIAAVLFAWARGRPDRQAVGRAVGRAAFGRAKTDDIELLAAGPGPILRAGSSSEARHAEQETAIADRDARLARIDASLAERPPGDRDTPAGDR